MRWPWLKQTCMLTRCALSNTGYVHMAELLLHMVELLIVYTQQTLKAVSGLIQGIGLLMAHRPSRAQHLLCVLSGTHASGQAST
jgi:hypothetical protein